MGFGVYLLDDEGNILESSVKHQEGGEPIIGGSHRMEITITHNYHEFFDEVFGPQSKGLAWLNDKRAKDVIGILEDAVKKLGTERDANYWKPTRGNAGYTLQTLLDWAVEKPQGIFHIS